MNLSNLETNSSIVYFKQKNISDEDLNDLIILLNSNLELISPNHIVIYDATNLQFVSENQRKMMLDFINDSSQIISQKILFVIYIIPSKMLQFVIKIVFAISKPLFNYYVAKNLLDANIKINKLRNL